MPLQRRTLRELAGRRLAEARALSSLGHHAGAYYLAGYAVELGLKACVARLFVAEEIPDWADKGEFRTHGFKALVRLAGLEKALQESRTASSRFDANVEAVLGWKVEARYDLTITPESAQLLVAAIGDEEDGVLTWIASRW